MWARMVLLFEVMEEIGKGVYGSVWRAEELNSLETFAIKRLGLRGPGHDKGFRGGSSDEHRSNLGQPYDATCPGLPVRTAEKRPGVVVPGGSVSGGSPMAVPWSVWVREEVSSS